MRTARRDDRRRGRTGRGRRAGLALALAALLVPGCSRAPRAKGPSVVLLVIDTLRADRLGCYGNAPSPSPELDAIAAHGVRFAETIANSTWTRPSFASFLTGLAPRATGIQVEQGDALRPRFTTLAEYMKTAGYRTFGATANPNLNRVFGFEQGFDHYLDSRLVFDWMNAPAGTPRFGKQKVQSADEVLGLLLDLVDKAGQGPFYLQADLMEVHEYHGLADPAHELAALPDDDRVRRYDAAIQAESAAIGRFLTELRGRPGFADALVVVTSDHGEGLADHPHVQGAFGHGFVVYDSQAHVPLLMDDGTGPLPEGLVVDAQVRMVDLLPTVLDLAGVQEPHGLAGRSMLPLIRGEEDPAARPRPAVVETHFRGANKLGLYEDGWRLVLNRDGHPGTAPVELFREGQPEDGARTSLAKSEPDRVRALSGQLQTWERLNPAVKRWSRGETPEDVQRQLKDLGY